MVPKSFIITGALTVPNPLIIWMKQWSTIHRLPADVQTEVMHCSIGENHMIFFTHLSYEI